MADFNSAVMTNAGIELLTKSIAGTAKLEFTELVTGSGIYDEKEKERSVLQTSTGLRKQEQSFPFSSVAFATDTCVKLVSLISNAELTSGYYVNEVGIYAKNSLDENSEAVLYSIAVAKIADYLPPYNGLSQCTITQEYFATVDNALEITIKVNAGAVALAEDLFELDQKVSELITVKEGVVIHVSEWVNNSYTIEWDKIKEGCIVDIYYSQDCKGIMADAEPSYATAEGKFVIIVKSVPEVEIIIESIKVVNVN